MLEQTGTAKKLTGQILENWLVSYADGHGGIQSLVKTSSTGTDPVIDTYTITYADTTTSTFTVTNGLKGDKGDQTYLWIKYAAQYPTADSDMSSSPDDWIGVYSGTSSTAPTHYTDYTWFEWKGATGDPGDPSEVTSYSVTYLEGTSGTVVPEGSWTTTIPTITPGNFLWTRLQLAFNDDTITTVYSVARFGIDGTGSVSSVNNQSPDANGNVALTASNIPADGNISVQGKIEELEGYYNVIRVNADGSGDYTTLSAAVNSASDGDIILVYPGTYFESVHAYNKLVHIKGIDKKTCILEYHGKDYTNPPLEMAKGSVENLTIIARNSGTSGNANAYCVHIDNDAEEGQSLYFRNVSFYNEIHQAVGIGLRHNFGLAFENCEFEAFGQAALYCHDWETNDTSADKTGQKITLLNCTLKNNDATHATIMLQSQELATNCATCKFDGCAVYNANANGKKISMTMWQGRTLTNASFLGSSDWVLDGGSSLNTEPLINATKDYVVEQYIFSVSGGIPSGAAGRRAAQVYLPDLHPDLAITGIQIVNIQASTDYNPQVFYSSGNIYCNYYAASGNASNTTQVVARVTYA